MALMHEPTVLLFDEPFTGLDPSAAADLRRLLAELVGGGRTAVLTTHAKEGGRVLRSPVGVNCERSQRRM